MAQDQLPFPVLWAKGEDLGPEDYCLECASDPSKTDSKERGHGLMRGRDIGTPRHRFLWRSLTLHGICARLEFHFTQATEHIWGLLKDYVMFQGRPNMKHNQKTYVLCTPDVGQDFGVSQNTILNIELSFPFGFPEPFGETVTPKTRHTRWHERSKRHVKAVLSYAGGLPSFLVFGNPQYACSCLSIRFMLLCKGNQSLRGLSKWMSADHDSNVIQEKVLLSMD